MTRFLSLVLALSGLLLSAGAQAWWNAEWTQRKKITLDMSATGADVNADVDRIVVPVRLHTGNFVFLDAKEDGADLRFVSADDKLPLKFHFEKFDPLNELAIVWVEIPRLAAGSAGNFMWMYYGNPKAEVAGDAKTTYAASQLGVYHFAGDGAPQDATGYGHSPAEPAPKSAATGFIDGAVAFDGEIAMAVPAAPALKLPAAGATVSGWIKAADVAGPAALFAFGTAERNLTLTLEAGKLLARVVLDKEKVEAQGEVAVTAGNWSHVAVTLGDKMTVYLNGARVAEAASKPAEIVGPFVVGRGFRGEMDEVQIAATAHSSAWVKAAFATQSPEGRAIRFGEPEAAESGGGTSYISILLGAVTLDGWIVIAILAVMAVLSVAVMFGKGMLVARTARANEAFRERFNTLFGEFAAESGAGADERHAASSLYRVYDLGLAELRQRLEHCDRQGVPKQLSPQALGAIKSSIDAGLVRENERLNSQMVLLTIAISGGPFLGLLGTVVGVMITFAAIAAVGDVNVNSIAPGIAAALVATVAGLGVAIPALFGYNYLASRIRAISNDMAVFADELVARFAERFAP